MKDLSYTDRTKPFPSSSHHCYPHSHTLRSRGASALCSRHELLVPCEQIQPRSCGCSGFNVCFGVHALRYGQDETQGSFLRSSTHLGDTCFQPDSRLRIRLILCAATMLSDQLGDVYTGPTHNFLLLPGKVATSDENVTRSSSPRTS
jgi:hypothetical protein